MSDVTNDMIERGLACYSEGGCSGLDEAERREVVSSILEAALSGTREAVEPVAWIVGSGDRERWRTWASGSPEWTTDRMQATRFARREDAEAVHREDEDAWRVEPLAAPPSDPVGQGAVTDAALAIALEAIDAMPGAGPFTEEGKSDDWRFRAKLARKEALDAARAHLTIAFRNAGPALSPAPEAGSDEVERLRAEMRESSTKWRDAFDSMHKRAMDAEARETALRDQLGKTRADAIEAVNQVVAERQADLHGKRSDFNKGAVDGLQHGLARLRRALSDAAEGGQ